ncbi:hypothetical protein [Burkholderia ubonensis]|uniref:Uncharacterized protein n=2 Tax=Burkholderia ubonensis TaxID=101571 RepID=A0A107G1B2_9BURK|nr:hypothetical protein [Burkholderia ubonensis]KWD80488.1 hypothetical protein WL71_19745 [Burkholderia ubonensis]KWD86407.1 hypothetical protein WL70_10115 [Burkholderia ubonensis]KWE03487.1 hypothetical protein WL72_03705 [Burkholderia ubonensis]KWE12629.1 hypothetical protein WL73_30975 [Burkholderia ubonensis]
MSNRQNIYERFHTPSDEVAVREVAAMSDEEHARAKAAATVHVRSRLAILLAPVAVGPWVPMFAYLLGMLAYRGMVDPAFDMDRAVGETAVTVIWVTAVFIAAWIGLNWCVATYGARQRYWREMPFKRHVELERHTLRSAIVVWSDDYDPEPLYVEEWIDGKLKSSRAGVRQWVLARTSVGLRLSGPAAPLTVTSYLLSHAECERLAAAAHHDVFFPPDQYGVVDPSDADWVGELAARALESEVPVDVAAGRALT